MTRSTSTTFGVTPKTATPLVAYAERDGFAILDRLITPRLVDDLIAWCEATPADGSAVARRGAVFARRNLLDDPTIRAVADHADVRRVVNTILSPAAFAVRAILFDKTPDANWTVPWHQDRSIAVERKIETPGFGPWSTKAGVVHVQPPAKVLRSMVTVRIHLDDCDDDNGPLRVVPCAHGTPPPHDPHRVRNAGVAERITLAIHVILREASRACPL